MSRDKVEAAVQFLLTEADVRLRALMRNYSQSETDENAHAIARHVMRTMGAEGGGTQNPGRRRESIVAANTREATNNIYSVLIFHGMPVAYHNLRTGEYFYTTDGRASSPTTAKRINAWIPGRKQAAEEVSAREIKDIYDEM